MKVMKLTKLLILFFIGFCVVPINAQVALGFDPDEENLTHTRRSGDLRTHAQVVTAMQKSPKYKNFLSIVQQFSNISIGKFKGLFRIIESLSVDEAKPFSKFSWEVFEPIYRKAKAEKQQAEEVFEDLVSIFRLTFEIDPLWFEVLEIFMKHVWEKVVKSYKDMVAMTQTILIDFQQAFVEEEMWDTPSFFQNHEEFREKAIESLNHELMKDLTFFKPLGHEKS